MTAPRHAGGPRGGQTFSWHKRPGWVMISAAWKDGRIVRAMWAPPARPARPEPTDADRPQPRQRSLLL